MSSAPIVFTKEERDMLEWLYDTALDMHRDGRTQVSRDLRAYQVTVKHIRADQPVILDDHALETILEAVAFSIGFRASTIGGDRFPVARREAIYSAQSKLIAAKLDP